MILKNNGFMDWMKKEDLIKNSNFLNCLAYRISKIKK